MKITPFATEHFFAKYEFTTPYQVVQLGLRDGDGGGITGDGGYAYRGIWPPVTGLYRIFRTSPSARGDRRCVSGRDGEDVLILGTPIEGIYLAARAILDPGDEVIVLSPAYDALVNMFAHVVGAENVRKWAFAPGERPLDAGPGGIESLITPKTKLLVVNFPQIPPATCLRGPFWMSWWASSRNTA